MISFIWKHYEWQGIYVMILILEASVKQIFIQNYKIDAKIFPNHCSVKPSIRQFKGQLLPKSSTFSSHKWKACSSLNIQENKENKPHKSKDYDNAKYFN